MLSYGVIKTDLSKNPVSEIMNNPEELERMVSENNDSVSIVYSFVYNKQKRTYTCPLL